MKVGLYLPVLSSPPTTHQIEHAVKCEQLGFYSLWTRDVLLRDDNRAADFDQGFESLVYLSYISALTTDIQLGTAAIALPLRHPVLLAKQAASLDLLSQGRFRLGVGGGYRADLYDVFGVQYEERQSYMDEALALCSLLWSGQPVSYSGLAGTLDGQEISPHPYTSGGPAVYLASSRPPSAAVAGSLSGWMTHRASPSKVAEAVRDARSEAPQLRVVMDVAVAFGEPDGSSVDSPGLGKVLVTSPEKLVLILRAYENAGIDEVIMAFAGSMPKWAQIELIAERVLPHIS